MENDLPKCPDCGEVCKEIYSNNGFNEPDGQSLYEVVAFECPNCGEVDAIIPKNND